LRSTVLLGPAEEIAESVGQIEDSVGVPIHLVARSYFPAMAFNQQLEGMQRIAEELLPLL
jgi:hypothetical protein